METPSEAPAETLDQPTEGQIVAENAANVEAPTDGQSFEAPFNINDVDETYRGDVERYVKQTQAAFTQKTQELAGQRKQLEQEQQLLAALRSDDPDLQTQALQALGLEIADDEPPAFDEEPEADDPVAQLQARLDALEQEREQARQSQTEEQQYQQIDSHVNSTFDLEGEKLGREVPDTERELALSFALTEPPGQDGMPNVNAGMAKLEEYFQLRQQAYVASKQAGKPGGGVSGEPAFNFQDRDQRLARMAAVMESNDA